jgi:hypothetical protein
MKSGLRVGALASLLLMAPHSERASACGGPDIVDVGELLAPQRALVADLLQEPWEGTDLADFTFLQKIEPDSEFRLGLAIVLRGLQV